MPGARNGECVRIGRPGSPRIGAEVISCDGPAVSLLPLASTAGLGVGDRVRPAPDLESFPCCEEMIGRILDPFGAPLDGLGPTTALERRPLHGAAPDPLARPMIDEQLVTGIRAVDALVPVGKGQRIGLYSGPGAGKSTLLGTLASRGDCDSAVVCLVGERGREAREFAERSLGSAGLARSVLIVATADAPAAVRARAVESATAAAEWLRDRGLHVLLLVDSLTRVARAKRDAALSIGELPARGGYPASALSALPPILERAGRSPRGTITAVYTVLTEGRDDPVAEETRSLLDGHIVLCEKMAGAGRWPAIDPLASASRVMAGITPEATVARAQTLRRIMGAYRRNEDLILMGAYRAGSCRDTDRAIELREEIDSFLLQGSSEETPLEETRRRLEALVS